MSKIFKNNRKLQLKRDFEIRLVMPMSTLMSDHHVVQDYLPRQCSLINHRLRKKVRVNVENDKESEWGRGVKFPKIILN